MVLQTLENEHDADRFALWAFGEDYNTLIYGFQFMDAWNKLHGKELFLQQKGIIIKDLTWMLDLWKKEDYDPNPLVP